jgi:hypothetical protein
VARNHETVGPQGTPETTSGEGVPLSERGLQIVGHLPDEGVSDAAAAAYLVPQQSASDETIPPTAPSDSGDA